MSRIKQLQIEIAGFDPQDFELLWHQLLEDELAGREVEKLGAPDGGADVLVDGGTPRCEVFQVKQYVGVVHYRIASSRSTRR